MLSDYFERVYVINLPSRPERLASVTRELDLLGFAPEQVEVPFAPVPEDDGGFPSRGVYGNFLSHLSILETARDAGLGRVLVLEDDAIFRRYLRRPAAQRDLVTALDKLDWTMWYGGHSLKGLPGRGLLRTDQPFTLAHCYGVHSRGLAEVAAYLRATMSRERGDPMGGRLYIDGAYSLLRRLRPDLAHYVSAPPVSKQKGSDSGLGGLNPLLRIPGARIAVDRMRSGNDQLWRWSGVNLGKG